MKTHSAIELFVILVQLPNKSVKIDLKKKIIKAEAVLGQWRVERDIEMKHFLCPFYRALSD